jgi:hypothetical protein
VLGAVQPQTLALVAMGDNRIGKELWKINVGSGSNAPPINAIASGLCRAGPGAAPARNTRGALAAFPELRLQGNATMVFVFGL